MFNIYSINIWDQADSNQGAGAPDPNSLPLYVQFLTQDYHHKNLVIDRSSCENNNIYILVRMFNIKYIS